jgi:hypothetical protein
MYFDRMLFVPWSVETSLLYWKLSEAPKSERVKTIKCGYAKCVE